MSLFTDVFENLKPEELKRLERYALEKGYIARKASEIESGHGFKQIAHQIDTYYANRRKYPPENGIPLYQYHSSKDGSKIACMYITYKTEDIPLEIDLNPQFPQEIMESLGREVHEKSFAIINETMVGGVIVDQEELLFSFKEL